MKTSLTTQVIISENYKKYNCRGLKRNHLVLTNVALFQILYLFLWQMIWQTSASTVERKKQMTVERQSWHGYFMHRMWSCVCIYFYSFTHASASISPAIKKIFPKTIMGSKQKIVILHILPTLICLWQFSLNISCSVKMFLHYRYPVMPVDGGFTMHALEGQRQRTNFYVQHAKGKEREFMYIYKIRHFLLTVYFSFF